MSPLLRRIELDRLVSVAEAKARKEDRSDAAFFLGMAAVMMLGAYVAVML